MDTTLLVQAASQAGVTGLAMIDAISRGTTYFSAKDLTPEHLAAWVAGLKTEAPHLFAPAAPADPATVCGVPPELWARLSPAERSARWRATLPPVVRQKPGTFIANAEQLKQLEGKSPTERRTMAWQWQQEAQQGGNHG